MLLNIFDAKVKPLIHTGLQPGDLYRYSLNNRFNGFSFNSSGHGKPLKRFLSSAPSHVTGLKPGVNKKTLTHG